MEIKLKSLHALIFLFISGSLFGESFPLDTLHIQESNWFFHPKIRLSDDTETKKEPKIGCRLFEQKDPSPECQGLKSNPDFLKQKSNILNSKPILLPHIWKNLPNYSSDPHLIGQMGIYAFPIPKGFLNQHHIEAKDEVYSSFFLWAERADHSFELICKTGNPSLDSEKARDLYQLQECAIPDETNILWLEVANWQHHLAGFHKPFLISNDVSIGFQLNKAIVMLVFGAFIMSSIFNWILFYYRRKLWANFWFGCFTASVSFHYLILSRTIEIYFPQTSLGWLILKIQFFTFILSAVFFNYYIFKFFHNTKMIKVVHFFGTLTSLECIFILITPVYYASIMRPFLHITLLLFSIFMLYSIYSSYKSSLPQDKYKPLGTIYVSIFLFFTIINDLAITNDLIDSWRVLPLGIFVFLIGHTSLLARENAEGWVHSENLYNALQRESKIKDNILKAKNQLESEKYTIEENISILNEDYQKSLTQLSEAKTVYNETREDLERITDFLIQTSKSSEIGEMVSGLSQEIETPLNHIESARLDEREQTTFLRTYLLKFIPMGPEGLDFKKTLDEKISSILENNEKIKLAIKNISEITHSMKSISSNDVELSMAELKEIISESLTILGSKLKSIQVSTEMDANPITIKCKRSQISQVVINLLNNACDAIREKQENEGGQFQGKIRIKCGEDSSKLKYCIIEDNGYGVPENIRNKVFETFFTTKSIGVGTGLGLSMVQKIIQNHKGILKLEESSLLGGAKFTIYFNSDH
jgi:signal transduction histidine kinase